MIAVTHHLYRFYLNKKRLNMNHRSQFVTLKISRGNLVKNFGLS